MRRNLLGPRRGDVIGDVCRICKDIYDVWNLHYYVKTESTRFRAAEQAYRNIKGTSKEQLMRRAKRMGFTESFIDTGKEKIKL